MKWIKRKLRIWLEIDDDVSRLDRNNRLLNDALETAQATALDCHFRGNSLVIVASRLNGGHVRIIETHFESVRDIEERLGGFVAPFAVIEPRQRANGSLRVFDMPHNSF